MEANRAGTEVRVRCPILPSRKEQTNVSHPAAPTTSSPTQNQTYLPPKTTYTRTTPLRRCPPSPGLFVFKIFPVVFNCYTLRKSRPLQSAKAAPPATQRPYESSA